MPRVAAATRYSCWNSAAVRVRGVYFGAEHRSLPNRASSLSKLAETPTHAIAMTDVCGTAGPEKVATLHVPNTGSLGADAQAAATTQMAKRPTPSLCVTITLSIPPCTRCTLQALRRNDLELRACTLIS